MPIISAVIGSGVVAIFFVIGRAVVRGGFLAWGPFGLHAATRSPLYALDQRLVADSIFVNLVQEPSRAGAMHVLNAMNPIRRSVAGPVRRFSLPTATQASSCWPWW